MSRTDPLMHLKQSAPAILPSLLLCDFGNLEREVEALHTANVPGLHLDVMDGQFVPNFTYGMPIVKAFRQLTDLPLDVHLMISQPEKYIGQFIDAGADIVTIHVEATEAPRAALQSIQSQGAAAGLAFNPATPLETAEDCLDVCDLLLVMSVDAGFGGQAFNPVALEKLNKLRERVGESALLEVDGGINASTIRDCATAGAQLFVVGSAIFKTEDYTAAVAQLQQLATVAV